MPSSPAGCGELAQQRGHRPALVGKDSDVALGAAQHEDLDEYDQGCGRLAYRLESERLECADLDRAACPLPGFGLDSEAFQQVETLMGRVAG